MNDRAGCRYSEPSRIPYNKVSFQWLHSYISGGKSINTWPDLFMYVYKSHCVTKSFSLYRYLFSFSSLHERINV